MDNLLAFGLFNVIYATYLETSPGTKGILIRPDSTGNRKINLSSYWNFIKQPITGRPEIRNELWKPQNWDINYPFTLTMFMTTYNFLH
jgi:hypothetical protein